MIFESSAANSFIILKTTSETKRGRLLLTPKLTNVYVFCSGIALTAANGNNMLCKTLSDVNKIIAKYTTLTMLSKKSYEQKGVTLSTGFLSVTTFHN